VCGGASPSVQAWVGGRGWRRARAADDRHALARRHYQRSTEQLGEKAEENMTLFIEDWYGEPESKRTCMCCAGGEGASVPDWQVRGGSAARRGMQNTLAQLEPAGGMVSSRTDKTERGTKEQRLRQHRDHTVQLGDVWRNAQARHHGRPAERSSNCVQWLRMSRSIQDTVHPMVIHHVWYD